MDINSLKVVDVTGVVIKHPVTGVDTDIVVYINGHDSEKFKFLAHEQLVMLKELADGGEDIKSPKIKIKTQLDMLAGLVSGWDNITTEGKVIEYSEDACRKLMKDCPWIAEQLDTDIYTRGNFFTSAQTP